MMKQLLLLFLCVTVASGVPAAPAGEEGIGGAPEVRATLLSIDLGLELWGARLPGREKLAADRSRIDTEWKSSGASGTRRSKLREHSAALEQSLIEQAGKAGLLAPHPLAPSRAAGGESGFARAMADLTAETAEMFADWKRMRTALARFGLPVDQTTEETVLNGLNDRCRALGRPDVPLETAWMGYKKLAVEKLRLSADVLSREHALAALRRCAAKRRALGARLAGYETAVAGYARAVARFRRSAEREPTGETITRRRETDQYLARLKDIVYDPREPAPAVYPGSSLYSTGRFALDASDSGLLNFEVAEGRLTRSGGAVAMYRGHSTDWSLSFRVPDTYPESARTVDASWTHVRRAYLYRRVRTGVAVRQTVTWPLGAPGIVVETAYPEIMLSQTTLGTGAAPDRLICVVDGIVRSYTKGTAPEMSRLTEGWLVLCWEDQAPRFPVLVVLEHRPDAAVWREDGLVLTRKKNIGLTALATLYGAVPQPATERPVEEIAAQAGKLAPLLLYTPLEIDELFTLRDRTVTVYNRVISALDIRDDWHTPRRPYTPLPPLYALALDQHLPVTPESRLTEPFLLTKYGPYRVTCDPELVYRMPQQRMWDRHVLAGDADTDLQQAIIAHELPWSPWMLGTQATSWLIMDAATRGKILRYRDPEKIRPLLDRTEQMPGYERFRDFDFCLDPVTGRSYWTLGWRGSWKHGVRLRGDCPNLAGCYFVMPYTYAKGFGRWDLIEETWSDIVRSYSVVAARQDWAGPGHDCLETGYIFGIDMISDGFVPTPVHRYLAGAVGDEEQAALASYIGSRTAITLAAMQRPETENYQKAVSNTLADAQPGLLCDIVDILGFSFIGSTYGYSRVFEGCGGYDDMYPIYDVMLETAPRTLVDILGRMRALRPRDAGMNLDSDMIVKLAAWAAGDDPAALREYVRALGFLGGPKKPNTEQFYSPSLSPVIGRSQPLWLAEWDKALIERAFYSSAERLAAISLNAPRAGRLACGLLAAPARISIDDLTLTPDRYNYDAARKELYVPFESGRHTIRVYCGNWDIRQPGYPDLSRERPGRVYPPAVCPPGRWTPAAALSGDIVVGKTEFIDISAVCNTGFADPVAGDRRGGTCDDGESWNIPSGETVFRGVPFRLIDPARNNGRSIVTLAGKVKDYFPRLVTRIPVHRPVKRLFFLHAAAWSQAPEGTLVLTYLIHFKDGQTALVEVRHGREIGEWKMFRQQWRGDESLPDLPEARGTQLFAEAPGRQAGSNRTADGRTGRIGFYVMEWVNKIRENLPGVAEIQKGSAEVTELDIISNGTDIPMIFAVTAEGEQ